MPAWRKASSLVSAERWEIVKIILGNKASVNITSKKEGFVEGFFIIITIKRFLVSVISEIVAKIVLIE